MVFNYEWGKRLTMQVFVDTGVSRGEVTFQSRLYYSTMYS